MNKFQRCIKKVRTQKRNEGYKHWAKAAVPICIRSCRKCKRKK